MLFSGRSNNDVFVHVFFLHELNRHTNYVAIASVRFDWLVCQTLCLAPALLIYVCFCYVFTQQTISLSASSVSQVCIVGVSNHK